MLFIKPFNLFVTILNLLYKNLYFKFTYSFNLFIVLNLHSRFTSFILSAKPYEVIFV